MRRHTPPPPGGPRTAPEGDTQIWPRPSTSILGPPTAATLSRPGPTSLLTHTSEPTCSGSAYVSALAPYGRPRVALFGRPLTQVPRSRRQGTEARPRRERPPPLHGGGHRRDPRADPAARQQLSSPPPNRRSLVCPLPSPSPTRLTPSPATHSTP